MARCAGRSGGDWRCQGGPRGIMGMSAPREGLGRYHRMPSTVIKEFDYRPESWELLITFVTGRRYLYSEVPVAAVDRLRAAYSKGSHFNRFVRDRYPCRELAEST